jgi:hypothetical protein
MWAQSPHAVSGVLCGLDGEKAEVPSTISGLDFEWLLLFLCGINGVVPNLSPCSFNLQQVGVEIAFPHH